MVFGWLDNDDVMQDLESLDVKKSTTIGQANTLKRRVYDRHLALLWDNWRVSTCAIINNQVHRPDFARQRNPSTD